ncbi:hypothetical protein O1611_g9840 [Lasiodiplodia mahajangana]|uniref:Uncharacterized protein n=1 Tax=Lasiodiplodia mahajangana TaxID=1108764 RepID=A0ACC2J4N2_9PEZI|nr:hypothetical protein O1611_g9840 [Lasiodiplodia mahajangana]
MPRVTHDEGLPRREEFGNREIPGPWYQFGVDVLDAMQLEQHPETQLRNSSRPFTLPEPSDWFQVRKPDSEDGLCRTISTDDADVHPTSPGPCCSTSSPSSGNDPNSDDTKLSLFLTEEELRESREQEQCQAVIIKAQEKYISNLDIIIGKEREISQVLGAKLYDLFIAVTQNQQHELDRVQKRLLDFQADAEDYLLSHEWRDLQEKLHNLNRKLDGYIKLTTPQSITAGTQTDELALFLSGLYGDLPKMWKDLRKLKRDIEEEKAKDDETTPESAEHAPERPADEYTKLEDAVDSVDMVDQPSVTDILDRYYEFSRFHRERMVARQGKLQKLLDLTSTELGRLQADLAYEEGRTANMKTRMTFWLDDLDGSKIKSPTALMENLDMKLLALKCGADELQKIADVVQSIPSYFHMIDIQSLTTQALTYPEAGTSEEAAKSPAVPQDYVGATGERENTLYIAELEAKLKEKQANEKAWAAHFESLHQRSHETKAELQKELDSVELTNTELRNVVRTVAGKLFEHRERLWGLSKPARQMGEELISTLEKLEVTCDEPLIYSD